MSNKNPNNSKYLYIFDTSGIKGYVSQRRYLPELRISSSKLATAITSLIKQLNVKPIYVGGGNALVLSNQSLNEKKINQEFKELLGYSSPNFDLPPHLFVHTNPKANTLLHQDQFAEARRTLLQYLGKRKRDLFEQYQRRYNHDPNSKICTSCQLRVVVNSDNRANLCNYCENLRNQGRNLIRKIVKKFDNLPLQDYLEYQMEYLAGTPSQEFGSQSGKYRLAVIQIDGNLFGYHFSNIQSEIRLRELSTKIERTMNEIFDEIIEELERNNPEDATRVKLGKVYIGGDDVKLIVPAKISVPVVYKYMKRFRELLNNEHLTLSAGIAIGKPKTPLSSLFELSDSLLRSAKLGYNTKGNPIGSFDIHVNLTKTSSKAVHSTRKFRKDNYEIIHPVINIGDSFWEKLNEFLELRSFQTSKTDIKETIVLPWKETHGNYLKNASEVGKKSTAMYTLHQSGRHQINKKNYRSAIEFLGIGNRPYLLEKALDLATVRYEL